MPEVISNTSPLQYLHQIRQLEVLARLVGEILVPPAVVKELSEGRRRGVDLPTPEKIPWVKIIGPQSVPVLPLITELGPGEEEVLALGLERPGSVLLLDDLLARRAAERLGLPIRGTLGVLLDGKKAGIVPAVKPLLDHLQKLRFRVSPSTRKAILMLAGESG